MAVVKTVFKDSVRRFNLVSSTWEELQQHVQKLYPELQHPTLSYRDEDDDLISLSSDAELKEALRITAKSSMVLRLFVADEGFEIVELPLQHDQPDQEDQKEEGADQPQATADDSSFVEYYAKCIQEREDLEYAKMLRDALVESDLEYAELLAQQHQKKKNKFTGFKTREPFKVVRVEEKVEPPSQTGKKEQSKAKDWRLARVRQKFTDFKPRKPFSVVRFPDTQLNRKRENGESIPDRPPKAKCRQSKFTQFKKREPFKVVRVEETVAASGACNNNAPARTPAEAVKEKRSNWRQARAKLRAAVREAKAAKKQAELRVMMASATTAADMQEQDQPRRSARRAHNWRHAESQCHALEALLKEKKDNASQAKLASIAETKFNEDCKERDDMKKEAPKQAAATHIDQPAGTEHEGFSCSRCGMSPIIGTRYSCSSKACLSEDLRPAELCSACEQTHPEAHPLVQYRVPVSRSQCVHPGTTCGECGVTPIRGPRFSCLVCPGPSGCQGAQSFDLCGSCEDAGIHASDHPMLKTNSSYTISNPRVPAAHYSSSPRSQAESYENGCYDDVLLFQTRSACC
jgi:hypothetical protein